jgi:hypothetical protein
MQDGQPNQVENGCHIGKHFGRPAGIEVVGDQQRGAVNEPVAQLQRCEFDRMSVLWATRAERAMSAGRSSRRGCPLRLIAGRAGGQSMTGGFRPVAGLEVIACSRLRPARRPAAANPRWRRRIIEERQRGRLRRHWDLQMTARYVYVRDPAGRPYRGDDGKHLPVSLLAEMGKCSVLNDDGTVTWRNCSEHFEPLHSFFVVLDGDDGELNEHDTEQIVWNALGDVARRAPGKPLVPADVVKAADKRAADFCRQPLSKFVMVASLSVKSFPAKRIIVRGSIITPLRSREPGFPLPTALRSAQHRDTYADHLKTTRYRLVKVKAAGRTMFEAVGQALDDLNLLRAVWSFAAKFDEGSRWCWGARRKPIGIIHTGPVYTLHRPDGSAANEDSFWFDPGYAGEQPLFAPEDRRPRAPQSGWPRIERDRRWAMKRISRLPYRNDIEQLLTRYVAALDDSNPNNAFLQLWGILEKITNTVELRGYDDTIRRAVWVFAKPERPLMREVLESLRHHRNRYVHSGHAGQVNQEIAYRIKSIVDPHLVRLLRNTFGVSSLQEYGEFLAQPTDSTALEKRRRWIGRALRAAREEEGSDDESSR